MIGAEAILRTLRAMGVERIFASPGSDWAPLWEALARPHAPGEIPEYVSVRHEETAIAMASAYSKAGGRLPAVVLHTTVGTLHAAMALRIALHERVPMVVMAGESITFGEPPAPLVGRQWLRLLTDTGGPARLIEPCVKWSVGLNACLILPQTVQRACQLALNAPRGPVFVSVPIEYLMETMAQPLPEPSALPRPVAAHPAALDELARALSAARKPLIITEEAGRDPAAVRSLVALAEALGSPVAEAWQPYYVNFPREHPLYAGVVPEIEGLVKEADAVLLVESVVPWHPPSSLGKGVKIYAIGEDPLRSNLPFWGFRADLVVPGELRSTLDGLLSRIDRKETPRTVRQDVRPVAAAMNTAWIAQELNEVLRKGAVVVNETITHRLELLRRLTKLEPGGFYESSFGGLGVGLGVALGVKYAQPERTVIATIGDGAFHYNPVLASFGASQELGLPMLVVLFDNAGYLSQKTDVKTYYPDGSAVRTGRFAGTAITPRPEYAKLAEAYGGYGEKVTEAGQARAALQRGLQEVEKGRLALVHMVLE
ncbi:MAG: thiamine pyrophosphate-binding protein [Betaproteobacteria bacterium]|nr:MAG: thiamine pyrophosphate-binding protein [Betaproteobacteria bacterium]